MGWKAQGAVGCAQSGAIRPQRPSQWAISSGLPSPSMSTKGGDSPGTCPEARAGGRDRSKVDSKKMRRKFILPMAHGFPRRGGGDDVEDHDGHLVDGLLAVGDASRRPARVRGIGGGVVIGEAAL